MAIDPCYRRLHIAFNHTSSLISKIQIIILQNKKNVLRVYCIIYWVYIIWILSVGTWLKAHAEQQKNGETP